MIRSTPNQDYNATCHTREKKKCIYVDASEGSAHQGNAEAAGHGHDPTLLVRVGCARCWLTHVRAGISQLNTPTALPNARGRPPQLISSQIHAGAHRLGWGRSQENETWRMEGGRRWERPCHHHGIVGGVTRGAQGGYGGDRCNPCPPSRPRGDDARIGGHLCRGSHFMLTSSCQGSHPTVWHPSLSSYMSPAPTPCVLPHHAADYDCFLYEVAIASLIVILQPKSGG